MFQVNGHSLVGTSHHHAVQILKSSGIDIVTVVSRPQPSRPLPVRSDQSSSAGTHDRLTQPSAAGTCDRFISFTQLSTAGSPDRFTQPSAAGTHDKLTQPSAAGTHDQLLSVTQPSEAGTHERLTQPLAAGTRDRLISVTQPSAAGAHDRLIQPSAAGTHDRLTQPSAAGTQDRFTQPSAAGTHDRLISNTWPLVSDSLLHTSTQRLQSAENLSNLLEERTIHTGSTAVAFVKLDNRQSDEKSCESKEYLTVAGGQTGSSSLSHCSLSVDSPLQSHSRGSLRPMLGFTRSSASSTGQLRAGDGYHDTESWQSHVAQHDSKLQHHVMHICYVTSFQKHSAVRMFTLNS